MTRELYKARIHATMAEAEATRLQAIVEIGAIIKKAGIAGAVLSIGTLHREFGHESVSVVTEGIGNPDVVYQMADAVLRADGDAYAVAFNAKVPS